MSYNIIAIPNFKKELKKLGKKYPSLKSDFAAFLGDLKKILYKVHRLEKTALKSGLP